MVPKSPGIPVRPKEPVLINQTSALCIIAQAQRFVTFQYGGQARNLCTLAEASENAPDTRHLNINTNTEQN